jgi:recombinational DNA repair protein (RecF pathway)
MHDEERNEPIFETVSAALRALNQEVCVAQNVLVWFMVHFSSQLGYALNTVRCGVCQEPVSTTDSVPFSLSMGAPLCAEHQQSVGYESLSSEAFELLCAACEHDADSLASLANTRSARIVVLDMLTSFFRYHIDGLRRLNVSHVALKMLGDVVRS